MKLRGPLLLVGCGEMGGALLEGWLARGLPPADVWIVEPNAAPLQGIIARGVHHAPDAAELPADLKPALMVFAVQPQMLSAALPHYRRFAAPESTGGGAAALFIAAGWRLCGSAQALAADTPVRRASPHTPARREQPAERASRA